MGISLIRSRRFPQDHRTAKRHRTPVGERKRERERERKKKREKEREGEKEGEREKERERERKKKKESEIERARERERAREIQRERKRERAREKEKKREREREREKEEAHPGVEQRLLPLPWTAHLCQERFPNSVSGWLRPRGSRCILVQPPLYRGTSLIRKRLHLEPSSRLVPMVAQRS